jgi:hypothetical protein
MIATRLSVPVRRAQKVFVPMAPSDQRVPPGGNAGQVVSARPGKADLAHLPLPMWHPMS